MVLVYFHATDGFDLVVDRRGLRLWDIDLEHCAARVAGHLRRRFGTAADLSEWLVVVQDEYGHHLETFDVAALPEIVEQDLVAA